MSKILQAMQLGSPRGADLKERLQLGGETELHPLPNGDQIHEFEDLASSLLHIAENRKQVGGAVVVFSSTNQGEGASYVSYNCARILSAMVAGSVCWVDANFRSPHKKLKDNSLTLKRMLTGACSVSDCVTRDSGLTVIGSGMDRAESMKMFSGSRYLHILDAFRSNFMFSVIDGPPILDSVELGHLAKNTLGLVVVVESRRLKYEVVKHGLEKISGQNVEVLGTVLNKRQYQLPEFLYKRF